MHSNKKGRTPNLIPSIGERYGKLIVDSLPELIDRRRRVWCVCDCGNRLLVRTNGLLTNNTKSCGCSRKERLIERNFRHGFSTREGRTVEYKCWGLMIRRCSNEDDQYYGGRGIKVCEKWRNSFEEFYKDMGKKPSPFLSIERKDVNGDYCPENCIWATDKEQANNNRRNRRLTFNNKTQTLTEWAKEIGITASALHGRINRTSVEIALSFGPKGKTKSRMEWLKGNEDKKNIA